MIKIEPNLIDLKEIEKNLWEIQKQGEMNVPGRIYGDKQIISHLIEDVKLGKQWNALKQVYNVACLPGIQKASLAMPDVHPGYGFAIGGVGAFDTEKGVISVAGVGFDINCGVRCLRTNLTKQDILQNQEKLAETLYQIIPAGLGSKGDIKLNFDEINDVLVKGAEFCVERKYGTKEDLKFIEENGRIDGANPNNVSDLAKKRQFKQIGTLGSGNHYLEVQYVDEIHDEKAAKAYNLQKDQVIISIHCGSRALGHQIGTDYLKELAAASRKYKIPIREKELVCAPFKSQEGQKYFSAVNAGINCAFANRQALAHLTRTAFEKALGTPHKDITTLYEVAHNTCKLEEHDGMQLIIHRKGATRAFGPGKKEIPEAYQETGQPVIIGGTMGTHSYILHGTEKGMQKTFGSACHGAGRIMSRNEAKRKWRGTDVLKDLRDKGIIIKGHSFAGIAEEAPGAYKEVTEVVNVMHDAHIARKVVKVKPLVVVKG